MPARFPFRPSPAECRKLRAALADTLTRAAAGTPEYARAHLLLDIIPDVPEVDLCRPLRLRADNHVYGASPLRCAVFGVDAKTIPPTIVLRVDGDEPWHMTVKESDLEEHVENIPEETPPAAGGQPQGATDRTVAQAAAGGFGADGDAAAAYWRDRRDDVPPNDRLAEAILHVTAALGMVACVAPTDHIRMVSIQTIAQAIAEMTDAVASLRAAAEADEMSAPPRKEPA